MNLENFEKEEKIIDLMKANLVALKYLLLFVIIFAVPFFLIWQNSFSKASFSSDYIFVKLFSPVVGMILGIIAHELIHGMFFAMYAKQGFKSIKFGILWKMLTPYCHCKEPLQIKHYKIALLAPFVILGIIPSIISLFTGNLILLIFGIFFSGAAAGDLMIYQLIKKENPEDYVQDHPTEAGYIIFKNK
ncbi:DUF3267 domain-containing protein [Kaistella montana]|uniref:DUF3267 domain-containing protein n=1 Tax=Kaistella montana TaxID=1849733 RepID=A0ABW5K9P2_9FLAO|nr:DUF3267 domain-containing protein [Kaistella montana]MCQ4035900.1 DUF3267 domain-containing protein [Kaistella montana]